MKICLIAEGCYPYVIGGVSSWIHSLIQSFPQHRFSVIAILSDRSKRGKFVYELPANLDEVYEIYLMDQDWSSVKLNSDTLVRLSMKSSHRDALRSLIMDQTVDWNGLFELCRSNKASLNHLLMSPVFLDTISEFYLKNYRGIPFSDFLWTLRSIYLPTFITLRFTPPEADIFHCVATGYSGLIGSYGKYLYPNSKLIVSEHGIYTREREEELIKAHWVQGVYKDIWISHFKKMSMCAYQYADLVTSLYMHARELQIDLGCPPEKTMITPNGINVDRYRDAPMKDPNDPYFNIGAIVRVTPIKDIKTMVNAFRLVHEKLPRAKLWIMGPEDEDSDYARECHELVEHQHIENIEFTGRINTVDYIGKMDLMLLTSISEGQPLTILEGFALKKPSIATNVGNCYGLIYGEDDDFGDAGIVTPVMNISAISNAILLLAQDEPLRLRMGEAGYKRLYHKYLIGMFKETYNKIYDSLGPESARATGKER